jgi:HPt (histidine-containing phosphotransfer) domain-containing protein
LDPPVLPICEEKGPFKEIRVYLEMDDRNLNMIKDPACDRWAPPAQLLELDEHDSGLIAVLADAYERDTKCRLERIRLAMASGDTRGLSAEAHSIKGGAWQMGAPALADMCFNLERNASHLTGAALAESVGTLETLFTENLRAIARYLAEVGQPSVENRPARNHW